MSIFGKTDLFIQSVVSTRLCIYIYGWIGITELSDHLFLFNYNMTRFGSSKGIFFSPLYSHVFTTTKSIAMLIWWREVNHSYTIIPAM